MLCTEFMETMVQNLLFFSFIFFFFFFNHSFHLVKLGSGNILTETWGDSYAV